MIIKIDDSIIEKIDTSDWASYLLRSAAISHENGHHLIIISPTMEESIQNSQSIGPREKTFLKSIINKQAFLKNQSEEKFSILCHYQRNDLAVSNRFSFDFAVYEDDYRLIDRIFHRSYLVLEDLDDDIIYKFVYTEYIKNNKSNLNIDYIPQHGGGDRSHNVCRNLYQYNFNIFSICDSDKKTPTCNKKGTSVKLQKFFTEEGIDEKLSILECHELENLIPLTFVVKKKKTTHDASINFLMHAASIDLESYLYADLKDWHTFDQVFLQKGTLSNYWKHIYDSSSCGELKREIELFNQGAKKNNDRILPNLNFPINNVKVELKQNYAYFSDCEIYPQTLMNIYLHIGDTFSKWFIASRASL